VGVYAGPDVREDELILYVDASNTIIPRIGNTSLTANGGVSGPSNGYYTFDGTDDAYAISNSVYNTTYDGKTILVAARMSSSFGSPNIFRAMIGTSNTVSLRNFNLYIYRDGTGFRLHFSSGGVGSFSNYLNLNLNEWFVGGITHTSSNTLIYYLNGVQVGTATQTFSQFNSETNEFLGRADNFWNGDIASWMVYSRALTAQEIQQNFLATKSRFGL
jgi:hypothetical protein